MSAEEGRRDARAAHWGSLGAGSSMPVAVPEQVSAVARLRLNRLRKRRRCDLRIAVAGRAGACGPWPDAGYSPATARSRNGWDGLWAGAHVGSVGRCLGPQHRPTSARTWVPLRARALVSTQRPRRERRNFCAAGLLPGPGSGDGGRPGLRTPTRTDGPASLSRSGWRRAARSRPQHAEQYSPSHLGEGRRGCPASITLAKCWANRGEPSRAGSCLGRCRPRAYGHGARRSVRRGAWGSSRVPSRGGRCGRSGHVDLLARWREHVPLGAEALERLAVRVARVAVLGVEVQRMPLVGDLGAAVGACDRAEVG